MVTISLCMIVKNEESVLERCLKSVQEVADEIIVVDTGSADGTREIARKCGAKVYEYPWSDDFSKARNVSFAKASMDYCMWMDADDVLPDHEREKLLEWKQLSEGKENILMLRYAAGYDKKGNPTFVFYRERIVKRTLKPVWIGKVHETIVAEGCMEYMDILIEHHSRKQEYSKRNLRIYKKMLEAGEVFSPRDQFYYARELFYHRKYEDCVENFLKFLGMPDGFVENKAEACRFCARACDSLGLCETGLEFLYRGLTYRVPSGELCCDIGEYFFEREKWELAIFWYENALHVPCEEKRGGFVQREYYEYIPCIQLSVCWYKLGAQKRAATYHKMAGLYKPYGEEFLRNKKYFELGFIEAVD